MTKYIYPQTHCRRKNHGCAVVLLGATPGLFFFEDSVWKMDDYGVNIL